MCLCALDDTGRNENKETINGMGGRGSSFRKVCPGVRLREEGCEDWTPLPPVAHPHSLFEDV